MATTTLSPVLDQQRPESGASPWLSPPQAVLARPGSSPVNIPLPKMHASAIGRLEEEFSMDPVLYGNRRKTLAAELGVPETEIYSWFLTKRGALRHQLAPYPTSVYRQRYIYTASDCVLPSDSVYSSRLSQGNAWTPSPARRLRRWLLDMTAGQTTPQGLTEDRDTSSYRSPSPSKPATTRASTGNTTLDTTGECSMYCQEVLSPPSVFPQFVEEISPLVSPRKRAGHYSPRKLLTLLNPRAPQPLHSSPGERDSDHSSLGGLSTKMTTHLNRRSCDLSQEAYQLDVTPRARLCAVSEEHQLALVTRHTQPRLHLPRREHSSTQD